MVALPSTSSAPSSSAAWARFASLPYLSTQMGLQGSVSQRGVLLRRFERFVSGFLLAMFTSGVRAML